MARTKEEFDNWFTTSNGDPWNYKSKGVINRLHKSFNLMKKVVPKTFDGEIYELGAFNGDFTKLIAKYYTTSKIICNDISSVAIQQAKITTRNFSNIKYITCDFLELFDLGIIGAKNDKIFILIEALYYLNKEERRKVIDNIYLHSPQFIILSAPIWGGRISRWRN